MKPGLEEGGANLYQNLKDRSKSVGQGSHDHFLTVDRRNMIYGGVTQILVGRCKCPDRGELLRHLKTRGDVLVRKGVQVRAARISEGHVCFSLHRGEGTVL